MTADISALRKIWKDSFGDPDDVLDAFFATGFSPERCRFIRQEGQIVSALYWFDCSLEGQKIAYLYALATDPAHRGKGLARQLLTETHDRLRDRGYAGALLVPGERELFQFYEKIGYTGGIRPVTDAVFTGRRCSAGRGDPCVSCYPNRALPR